ncbi:transketolase [Propionibacterium sp. oral taxon 192 str. F0372]|uniref:transketolase n=1 Tax=Propionibacterium sp. oral taxon 192 TaxID=671222 RepID=UPI0003544E05|nr:transketolase [Propionibacterium sp. oral taxon 192]EPH02482.1 transketolase [Propionibacterium sp. oral taxon 192 str. F0372]
MTLTWTDEDKRAVDTARILAADAVQKVGNGHPGTAISLAPVAYLLYQKVMKTDPTDDKWLGRDRFVLSAGHASILQYIQLFLGGLGLEMDDIASLRTAGSLTPGHPEFGHTKFIECTTGPLGAGVSNAVGMAMAARRAHGLYDGDNAGESVFDHFVYVLLGEGCMQEGVQAEAASLAGTQGLGNLIMIYDENQITIEGDTKIAFGEDVAKRYEAYGWQVIDVDWTNGGEYCEDIQALYDAIKTGKAEANRPTLIHLHSIIGWPLPTLQGKEKIHGSAIGAEEITRLKELLGFEDTPFAIDPAIVDYTRSQVAANGKAARQEWDAHFEAWKSANPQGSTLLDRVLANKLPSDLTVPSFEAGSKATRSASAEVLTALAGQLPELWGGSADLAGSNNTTMKGEPSFLPADRTTDEWPGGPFGRTLHFGVREHAMGGILNGINADGLTRAYGGTFFVFSDYMRPTARLAALSKIPSIFVWTHDSIGVGEDGPTHQPVEHLAAYRAIPGLAIARPSDANETAEVWLETLRQASQPVGIILTRQNVRTVDRISGEYAPASGAAKGAYVLREASAAPQVILIGTGSEVEVALDAQTELEAAGIPTRVVSMPCQEWFDVQDEAYRDQVLPPEVTARVSVEAGIAMGWAKYVGPRGRSVSLEHFGASAKGTLLFEEYGITAAAVVAAAKESLEA